MQNTEVQYAPKTFKPTRLYNVAFPVLLGGSFLYLIIMLFITPVEKYASSSIGQVTSKSLGDVKKALGSVSMFGLRNPTKPGSLSRP